LKSEQAGGKNNVDDVNACALKSGQKARTFKFKNFSLHSNRRTNHIIYIIILYYIYR